MFCKLISYSCFKSSSSLRFEVLPAGPVTVLPSCTGRRLRVGGGGVVEGAVTIIDRAQLLADSPGVVRILVQIYLVVGEVVALDVVSSSVELPLLVKQAHVVAPHLGGGARAGDDYVRRRRHLVGDQNLVTISTILWCSNISYLQLNSLKISHK